MSAILKFPRLLQIRVVDAETEQPVSRIGLMLTIFAPRKNNYHLAKVTDGAGKVCVSLEEMRESIRTDQELFPMDYASSIDECEAEIEVKICNPEEVKKAVNAMEMFKSVIKIDEALIRGFKTSSNRSYESTSQRIKLEKLKDEVGVEISIRSLSGRV